MGLLYCLYVDQNNGLQSDRAEQSSLVNINVFLPNNVKETESVTEINQTNIAMHSTVTEHCQLITLPLP